MKFKFQINNGLIFKYNSFIKISFTYQISHPFKVYNSMVFSIFMELGNCHHNQL